MRLNWVGHVYNPGINADKVYMIGIRQVSIQWIVMAKWGRRNNKLSNQPKATLSNEAAAIQAMNNLIRENEKKGYLDITTPQYKAHIQATHPQISPLTMKSPGIVDNLETDQTWNPNEDTEEVPANHVVKVECSVCGKKHVPKVLPDINGEPESICQECIEKLAKAKEIAKKTKALKGEDETLICVDNIGMEDRFDVGIEYLVEEHTDPKMVFVYDKMGRKDEYFRTRFMTPAQWGKKKGIPSAQTEGVAFYQPKPGEKMDIRTMGPAMPTKRHFVGSQL